MLLDFNNKFKILLTTGILMTYQWIIPAPEFDSGAEKSIKQYILNSIVYRLLKSNSAYDGAQYLFNLHSTDISLLTELLFKT